MTPVLERMVGQDGREKVCIRKAQSPAFARACIRVWDEAEGGDHSWMLMLKAFWMPAEYVAGARAIVEAADRERAQELR